MNLDHILLATDLSEAARLAYGHAAGLARLLGARLTLLNVDEVSHFGFHTSSELTHYLERVSEARVPLIDDARDALQKLGVDPVVEIVDGDPTEQIPEYAHSHHVDLLIMAKRGLRNIERLILGRTSSRVLRRIKIPTLVVPSSPATDETVTGIGTYHRILAATDFSDASKRGLRAVLDLAEKLDAQVDYVHVIRLPVPIPALPGECPILVPRETSDQLKQALFTDLSQLVGSGGATRCSPSVTMGVSVAETLSEMAWSSRADLIVVPSQGRGSVRATLFGHTCENVIKLSRVPVLVLPAEFLAERYPLERPG
jgi:nucleotide-binding universal stress UspA family protein